MLPKVVWLLVLTLNGDPFVPSSVVVVYQSASECDVGMRKQPAAQFGAITAQCIEYEMGEMQ